MLLTSLGAVFPQRFSLGSLAVWTFVTEPSLLADTRNYCARITKRPRHETCNRLVDKILSTPRFWLSVCVAK
jgi:hypothetical protein